MRQGVIWPWRLQHSGGGARVSDLPPLGWIASDHPFWEVHQDDATEARRQHTDGRCGTPRRVVTMDAGCITEASSTRLRLSVSVDGAEHAGGGRRDGGR